MADRLVTLKRQGEIAIVSLNHPARHNALIPELPSQLLASFKHQHCQTARAVMLRAEGRSFSTGGDIAGFQQHRDDIATYSRQLVGLLNQVIIAIYTQPAPVACAVNGQVTGGSLGLLLASDHVVMRRGKAITPYYAVVGFSPDGGWTALLPDIIGRQQAMHWLANNESYDADTCRAMGLVHQVVEHDCDTTALAWAEGVTQLKAGSYKNSRQLINISRDILSQRLEAERVAFVHQIQSQQAMDGIDQFLRRQEYA